MRDHKKLRAFELADQLAMVTYKQTAKLPKDELFGLVSQMRRADALGCRTLPWARCPLDVCETSCSTRTWLRTHRSESLSKVLA